MVRVKNILAVAAVLTLAMSLGSCQILGALSSGKGTVKAEAHLPAKGRVLVFVDPRPSVQMSPDRVTQLAEAIIKHLYKYRAADTFVSPQTVVLLKAQCAKDNDFDKLGVADVARETNADVVLYVDVLDYVTPQLSESEISLGAATVMVKEINRDGKRLFPALDDAKTDTLPELGREVEAHVDFQLNEPTAASTIDDKLIDLLALRVGRLFHDYDGDDRSVAK